MDSVIATVCVSLVPLETVSSVNLNVIVFPTHFIPLLVFNIFSLFFYCQLRSFSVTRSGCKVSHTRQTWTLVEGLPSIHLAKNNVLSCEVANPLSKGMLV